MDDDLAQAMTALRGVMLARHRDWGEHPQDAWMWGIVHGWDCEQAHGHDGGPGCVDGRAMDELAARYGWDADRVAQLRRYRAAFRAAFD